MIIDNLYYLIKKFKCIIFHFGHLYHECNDVNCKVPLIKWLRCERCKSLRNKL